MPSRLTFMPGGDDDDAERQAPYQAKLRITEGMLDEAADRALVGVDDDQAYATRKLWAMDPALEVANAFQMSEAEVRDQSNFARVSNIRHVVKHVLTTEEVRTLVDLYGEFDLQFKNEVIHDHALAAAGRALDQRLLEAGVLPGRRYKDIGGSIMVHVERGDANVVVVKSDHDTKDPVRRVHENLRLRKIASGSVVCAGGEKSRLMAQDILAGGGRYYVDSDARLDETHTFSAIMNHVYDIPMEGIPVIMDSGRIKVLEGAIHFSNDFFELSKGELPNIGARFEIDRERDEFRMGFVGSAAPWYIHKFSDYARYGADQILEGKDSLYAYKIIQRRGDTLFFRVLRIGDGAQPNFRQYYALPGVDVVDVDGFELREGTLASAGPLRRKTWRFPANTWHTLMRDASVRASRGGLDFQDLVNTYRVAVVPHQLSGVSITPGTRVDMDLLVPMVVHAGFAAYADMVLFDLEISASMQAIQRQRGLADETTIYKAFGVFLGAVGSVGKVFAAPFNALGELLTRGRRDQLREMLVQWKPVPRIRRIHAANVLDLRSTDKVFIGTSELLMRDYMMDRREQDMLYEVAQDPKLAEEILGVCGNFMTADQGGKLRSVVAESNRSGGTDEVTTAPPSYATREREDTPAPGRVSAMEKTSVVYSAVDPNREQNRTNAINESIQENKLEAEKIEVTCVGYLRNVAYGGSVDHAALVRGREKMGQPDAWYVSNGVLTESALGEDPQEFSHGAVCCAKPSELTGSHIWAVYDEEYEGRDSATGRAVTRRHFVVRDSTYSGWVFVNDSLKVYNGPDALEALDRALEMTADYDVTLHQGGPGAGKTTQIVAGYSLGDMVVCPVRKSAEDTRAKLAEKFPAQPTAYWTTMVRTVDSILVNLLRSRRGQKLLSDLRSKPAVVVHADEAFMTSAGKWHAVFRLLGATSVVAYGDLKQIPHVPRVDAPKLYLRLQPDVWVYHWMVYRCRPEIMAIWVSEYEFKLRTPLKKGGTVARVYSAKGLDMRGDIALLVMYQADKMLLRQRYPKLSSSIMTVHESEGKTFDRVVLFNFEMRKRPDTDATYLFNKPPYVVVAASRARDSFTYVKKAKEPDLLVKWMERAADPRRVAAVMDVPSAGNTLEVI